MEAPHTRLCPATTFTLRSSSRWKHCPTSARRQRDSTPSSRGGPSAPEKLYLLWLYLLWLYLLWLYLLWLYLLWLYLLWLYLLWLYLLQVGPLHGEAGARVRLLQDRTGRLRGLRPARPLRRRAHARRAAGGRHGAAPSRLVSSAGHREHGGPRLHTLTAPYNPLHTPYTPYNPSQPLTNPYKPL